MNRRSSNSEEVVAHTLETSAAATVPHNSHTPEWDREPTQRALDELFTLARQYRSSESYYELMKFIACFHFYAPFNAMLVHIQNPGSRFVAPPTRWLRDYDRRVKTGAQPLVILQPMGPVMFVFDVSDTEPLKNARPLPPEVDRPFEIRRGRLGGELASTIENAKRDGVNIIERKAGSQSAGEIRWVTSGKHLSVLTKRRPEPQYVSVPLRFELLLNSDHPAGSKYATLVHELAHLYCGHLGSPDMRWWPDRRDLAPDVEEFEAESVCYLVCGRLGVDNPSEKYLAQFIRDNDQVPSISLDCVMKSAGLIEQMGHGYLPPRKEKA